MNTIIRSKHPEHADFDRAAERMEPMPLTPKRERARKTWGSLEMSLQTSRGLCSQPKCVRKEGHDGACWPTP